MPELTTLQSVKTRVGLAPTDVTHDALLGFFIVEVGARFEDWVGRPLGRQTGLTQCVPGNSIGIPLRCSPVEQITSWDIKTDEASGFAPVDEPLSEWPSAFLTLGDLFSDR
jgi:hypothetical protein